jgi:hypothetical protein
MVDAPPPILALPHGPVLTVSAETSAQRAMLHGVARDLGSRTSISALRFRRGTLTVTVRYLPTSYPGLMPVEWESLVVAEVVRDLVEL